MNDELTFYDILWRIVKAWPETSNRHERLNSFAVLEDIGSLESPSFGKDYRHFQGRTYYSRKWEQSGLAAEANEIEYPALALYEFDFQGSGFSRPSMVRGVHQFEVYLLAPMPRPVPVNADFDSREFYTFEQMSSYLKGMATSLMVELKDFVRISRLSSAATGGGSFNADFGDDFSVLSVDSPLSQLMGWQSKNWMNRLVANGVIAGYQYDLNVNAYVDAREISGPVTAYMLSDQLMGYQFRLNLATDVCRTVSGFDY